MQDRQSGRHYLKNTRLVVGAVSKGSLLTCVGGLGQELAEPDDLSDWKSHPDARVLVGDRARLPQPFERQVTIPSTSLTVHRRSSRSAIPIPGQSKASLLDR